MCKLCIVDVLESVVDCLRVRLRKKAIGFFLQTRFYLGFKIEICGLGDGRFLNVGPYKYFAV